MNLNVPEVGMHYSVSHTSGSKVNSEILHYSSNKQTFRETIFLVIVRIVHFKCYTKLNTN